MFKLLLKYRYQFPAFAYAIAIFFISSVPGDEIPALGIRYLDKVAHLIEYTIFGLLVIIALKKSYGYFHNRYWEVMLFVYGMGYGATDEIHQIFVVNRFASFNDFLFDCLGILLSYVLFVKFGNKFVLNRTTSLK